MPQAPQELVNAHGVPLDDSALKISEIINKILGDRRSCGQGPRVPRNPASPQRNHISENGHSHELQRQQVPVDFPHVQFWVCQELGTFQEPEVCHSTPGHQRGDGY
jgi:hypothetical protein